MARQRTAASTAKITQVTFRSSVPGDRQFQHYHVEATATVPEGEDPSDVLDGVKAFVARELVRAKEGRVEPTQGKFNDMFQSAVRKSGR